MPDQLLDIGVEPVRQGDQAPEQVGDDPVQRLGAVHDDGIPAGAGRSGSPRCASA